MAVGATTIAWSVGVIPDSAYADVVVSGVLNDRTSIVATLLNCIGTKGLRR